MEVAASASQRRMRYRDEIRKISEVFNGVLLRPSEAGFWGDAWIPWSGD